MVMQNKESIMNGLAARTARENLTGNAREDAVIFFKAALEYVEIEEWEKALFVATRAETTLLASTKKDDSTSKGVQLVERIAVVAKVAEYKYKSGDIPSALDKLCVCMENIEKNTELFTSTEVSNSPFYANPRQIAIAVQALENVVFEAVTQQHNRFNIFCNDNNLSSELAQ